MNELMTLDLNGTTENFEILFKKTNSVTKF